MGKMTHTFRKRRIALKKAVSCLAAVAVAAACMFGASSSVKVSAAGLFPTYMVRVNGRDSKSGTTWNHLAYAHYSFTLGSLTGDHNYVLRYLVSSDEMSASSPSTPYRGIRKSKTGTGDEVVINGRSYDENSKLMTFQFYVYAGQSTTYYLRYNETGGGTRYFAGFELYDVNVDSAMTNNLLASYYNSSNLNGWNSNWTSITNGATTLDADTVKADRVDFNAATMGITENKTSLPTKMISVTDQTWGFIGLKLNDLTGGHNYRLTYYSSQTNNTPTIAISNAVDGGTSATLTTNSFDNETKTKTVEFTIPSSGTYYLKTRQYGSAYLAGFQLYDMTADSGMTKNLLSYNLDYGLKNWYATTYGTPGSTGKTSLTKTDGNYTVTLNLMDFNARSMGLKVITYQNHSLTLAEEIGVNFYLDLSDLTEVERTGTYMTFAITNSEDEKEAYYDSEAVNASGYYEFSCNVSSVQMAESITPTYHYGNGKTVTGSPYSVKSYIDYVVANPGEYTPNTVTLAKALGDYGHYAQIYLDDLHSNSHTTMAKYRDADYTADELSAYLSDLNSKSVVTTKTVSGIDRDKVTYNLNFDSTTSLNVVVRTNTAVTATADSKAIDVVPPEGDGKYKVRISGLMITEIGTAHTISGTTGGATFTIENLSGLSYIRAILAKASGSAASKNAVAAYYDYYKAAQNYVNPDLGDPANNGEAIDE